MDIVKLARKNIRTLTPYQSARRIGGEGEVCLNANESPFKNIYDSVKTGLNRYSDCQPRPLIKAYAHYAKVGIEQVLVSRGVDESIDLLLRTFCEPNQDQILVCPPTYSMYTVCAEINNIRINLIPLTDHWQLNLNAMIRKYKNIKLLFLCHPNNPTGNLIKHAEVETLLEEMSEQAIIVIDEAYIDFCPQFSMVDLLEKYPNLVILRTLSKSFSLAGLRCGFTLANPEIIKLMLKIIAPYPIPIPVTEIACQALTETGIEQMQNQVNIIISNRIYLKNALQKLKGVTVFDSAGNYLLCRFPNAHSLFIKLWNDGIILRETSIGNCLRISIGNRHECRKTVAHIQRYLIS